MGLRIKSVKRLKCIQFTPTDCKHCSTGIAQRNLGGRYSGSNCSQEQVAVTVLHISSIQPMSTRKKLDWHNADDPASNAKRDEKSKRLTGARLLRARTAHCRFGSETFLRYRLCFQRRSSWIIRHASEEWRSKQAVDT